MAPAAPLRVRCLATRATVVSSGCRLQGTAVPSPPAPVLTPPRCCPQDKEQVLSDVRGIIAEQLGTDLDKVQPPCRHSQDH